MHAPVDNLEQPRTYLRKKPKASFAEIRDAAKKKRLTLWPISYGRAQLLEGIVTVKKERPKEPSRGPGRPKGSKNKRGPGRPRKVGSGGLDSLEALVVTVKNLHRERDQAVRLLEKIRWMIGDV